MHDNVLGMVKAWGRSSLALSSLLAFVACVTACTSASSPEGEAPPAGTPSPSSEVSPTRSEACVAIDDGLRRGLARKAKGADFDTVLVWSSEACAPMFLTVGPSTLEDTRLFRIGSITKTYVSVLTMSLAAEGRIGLDDRVGRWLPDMPAAAAEITVRQLLQHTSGLFNYTDTEGLRRMWKSSPKKHVAPRELVDLALAEAPYFAPGEGWHYTNTGYILLGMVLEASGGAPIGKLLRERVLAPNGLDETFFDGEEPVVGALAVGRDTLGNDVTTRYDPSWAWAAGAMVASPRNAARFFELLGQGKLLAPEMQAELTATTKPTGQTGLGYGLGVFVAASRITGAGEDGVGHGGDIHGFHTWAWHFAERKVTVFAGVDSDDGSGNDAIATALGVLFPPRK